MKNNFLSAFLAMCGAAMRQQSIGYSQKTAPSHGRTRNTKRGQRHIHNPAGTKLQKKAASGTLTYRHGRPVHSMV